MERPDIYEYFAEKLGCVISDLRLDSRVDWEPQMILSVPDAVYSLEEWSDFVGYVCHSRPQAASVQEAKSYLIDRKMRFCGIKIKK